MEVPTIPLLLDPTKGLKYLQEQGTNLILQMPPGGKSRFIVTHPGMAIENKEMEALPVPLIQKTAEGTTFKMSENIMYRFEISTPIDLMRMIRNIAILLTGFEGPVERDSFKDHLLALQEQSKKDRESTMNLMAQAMVFLDEMLNRGKRDLSPMTSKEAMDACDVLAALYKF